ncbi:MAG: hypothetical protein ACRC7N_22070 [Clostridium sp.]
MAFAFKNATKDLCNSFPNGLSNFSRLVVQDQLCITEGMPSIKKILSTSVDYKVVSTKLINTPVSISLEGQTLTGYKLLVEIELNTNILYESCVESSTQSALLKSKTIKSVYVVLPAEYKGARVCDLVRTNNFLINPITEYINTRIIDDCCVIFYGSIIIDVQLY